MRSISSCENSDRRRYAAVFCALAVLLVLLVILNLALGSVPISPGQIISAFSGKGDAAHTRILFELRAPRLLSALLLGGCLSVSGYLLQSYFNNPLAGPFVLGVSSGAKFAVAVVMIIALGQGAVLNSWAMIAAAFGGALLAMGFVLLASGISDNSAVLIISGVLIGYFSSALTEILLTFAQDTSIVNLHTWSQGSFSGITWQNVAVIGAVTLAGLTGCVFLAKPMGVWQMGEAYAANLGVNVRVLRISLILLSSLLAACVTAFAGPVAFVGIAVPHLMKSFLRTSRPLVLFPACFLGGSVFCLFSDLIARSLFAPTDLSISVVTSVLGAPVVIGIMLKRHRRRK